MIQNFKELEIWKKSMQLVKEIYCVTTAFPGNELYGLTSQMRRAAVSIPSNVAEGFKRKHTREFRQFLNVALGSLAELETQLIIAHELGYINTQQTKMLELMDHINRMIANLLKRL